MHHGSESGDKLLTSRSFSTQHCNSGFICSAHKAVVQGCCTEDRVAVVPLCGKSLRVVVRKSTVEQRSRQWASGEEGFGG